jgi:hypothetical protein
MDINERNAVIEECARWLEASAKQFGDMAKESCDEEISESAFNLSDSYSMAANEIRRMNPEHVAKEGRNKEKVKKWMKTIGTPDFKGFPDLESYKTNN